MENFLDCGTFPWLRKTSLFVENFLYQVKLFCGKFPWLRKTSLFEENFLDCRRISWSRKIFLTVQKFLYQGKFPWLWKNSLIKENFLDCGKLIFLIAEKIMGLIILKTNASVETIKTYILSLDQKPSLLAFFVVDKMNIIFSRRFKHKY